MAVSMSLLQPQLVASPLPFDLSSEAWNWLLPVVPDVANLGAHESSPAPIGWAPNNHSWPPQCRALLAASQRLAPAEQTIAQQRPLHSTLSLLIVCSASYALKKPPEVVSDSGHLAMPFQGLSDGT